LLSFSWFIILAKFGTKAEPVLPALGSGPTEVLRDDYFYCRYWETRRCFRSKFVRWLNYNFMVSNLFFLFLRSCDLASWHVTVHRDMWPCCFLANFFIIKPARCTNFTNLFWHETLHVSGSSSVHHQEFIHCTFSTELSSRHPSGT
jgi:hypothetical protein